MAKIRNPEFIAEFLELSRMAIEEAAPELMPEARADLADRIMLAFLDLWAGTSVYVPKNALPSLDSRDRAIFDAYDGTPESIRILARRHALSSIHIYRIIAAERARRRQSRRETTL